MGKKIIALPEDIQDEGIWKKIINLHFVYSLIGLIVGCFCIVGGILLLFSGISGSTDWSAKVLGSESKLSDAGPGVILFIVGLFVVITTRFSLKIVAKIKTSE